MYDKFTLLTCRKTQMATAWSPTVHIILFLKEILFESSVFDEKKNPDAACRKQKSEFCRRLYRSVFICECLRDMCWEVHRPHSVTMTLKGISYFLLQSPALQHEGKYLVYVLGLVQYTRLHNWSKNICCRFLIMQVTISLHDII